MEHNTFSTWHLLLSKVISFGQFNIGIFLRRELAKTTVKF